MRRLKRLPLEDLTPFLFTAPPDPTPINWPQQFGNDHPVELEVGFGKGLFLLTEAQRRHEVNFFGIEIERKYQLYVATRMAKRGLANVRVACAAARRFLQDFIPDDSVQAVHVYFPDPWWKTRHKKRRVFDEDFVRQCQRILRPNGHLRIATDVEEYFVVMMALLRERTALVPQPVEAPGEPSHDLDYLTNFERKFRKEGKAIFRAVYAKS